MCYLPKGKRTVGKGNSICKDPEEYRAFKKDSVDGAGQGGSGKAGGGGWGWGRGGPC